GKIRPDDLGAGGTTFQQFRDGTDATLVIGPVSPNRKIPWMKPEDIVVTDKLPKLGQPGSFDLLPYKTDLGSVAPFLRAEGRCFGILESIDGQMLRSLMTIAGGEKINWASVPSIGVEKLPRMDPEGESAPVLYVVRIRGETRVRSVQESVSKKK